MKKRTQEAPQNFDNYGRPGVFHRDWKHVHFPGGGMWLTSATVVADLVHHIIDVSAKPVIGPTAFSDYYDTFSGVSGGSITTGSILLPKSFGSKEPKYKDFTEPRNHMMDDSGSIFDEKKQSGFFWRKTWVSAVGHATDSLSSHFSRADQSVDKIIDTVLPDGLHPTSKLAKAANSFRAGKTNLLEEIEHGMLDALNWTSDLAVKHTHFDHSNLHDRLHDRLQTTYPTGRLRPAYMTDLVKPCIIPAITVHAHDNSFQRYINPSTMDKTIECVPDRFTSQFVTREHVATASLFSSLQSPLFRTAKHPALDHQTDGGALYTARTAVDDTAIFRQPGERRSVTVFECNMSDYPDYVQPKHLERAFLPQSVASNLRVQANANRQNDYMQMMMDPSTSMMVEFRRAARPTSIYPVAGPLREELEDFAWTKCRRDYMNATKTFIPEFGVLTQAATSRDVHKTFIDAGIQTAARMLPEAVRVAKNLIARGPLADKMTGDQQREILENIDNRFPPSYMKSLESVRATRGPGYTPRPHNDFVYFRDEESLKTKKTPANVQASSSLDVA
jgi:hypothetical protein